MLFITLDRERINPLQYRLPHLLPVNYAQAWLHDKDAYRLKLYNALKADPNVKAVFAELLAQYRSDETFYLYCDQLSILYGWSWGKVVLSALENWDKIFPSLDMHQFTPSQQVAVKKIWQWLDTEEKYFVLTGVPGSGKTYTITKALDVVEQIGKDILFLAPSHKAVECLELPNFEYIKATKNTIQSALAILPNYGKRNLKTGEIPFTASNHTGNKKAEIENDYNLLVIDEYSMITREMFFILDDIDIKILFVGDHCQLPPINDAVADENNRPLWDNDQSKCIIHLLSQQCSNYLITETKRFDGDILQYATKLRESIDSKLLPMIPRRSDVIKNHFTEISWLDSLINDFSEDKDTVAIAYRNDKVAEINNTVRRALFGSLADEYPFLEDERLVINSQLRHPVSNKKLAYPVQRLEVNVDGLIYPATKLPLHSRLTVLEIDRVKAVYQPTYFYRGIVNNLFYNDIIPEYYYWLLIITSDKTSEITRLMIVDDPRYWDDLAKIYRKARREKNKKVWQLHDDLLLLNDTVTYDYAITVNNSQGDTYDIVYVQNNDIMKDKSTDRNKRFYVASTRARKELHYV